MELLLLLLIKHAIFDLAIQRWHGWEGIGPKYYWLRLKSQKHYIEHGLGTLLVFMLFVDPYTALQAALCDWIAHWHIDWMKSNTNKYFGWREKDQGFWVLVTIDQALHYTTYILLASWFYAIPWIHGSVILP